MAKVRERYFLAQEIEELFYRADRPGGNFSVFNTKNRFRLDLNNDYYGQYFKLRHTYWYTERAIPTQISALLSLRDYP